MPELLQKFRSILKSSTTSRRRARRRPTFYSEQLEPRALLSTFYVSDDGSDDGRGTRRDPFASIQHAVDQAAAKDGNDVVRVAKGEYHENVSVNDQSGGLWLIGDNATIDGDMQGAALSVNASGTVVLRGLKLVDSTSGLQATGHGLLYGSELSATGNTYGLNISLFKGQAAFRNINVSDNVGIGVLVNHAERFDLINSSVNSNGSTGIDLRFVEKNVLSKVEASGNARRGVHIRAGNDTFLQLLTADKNGHDGLRIAGTSQRVVVDGLTARNNASDGVDLDMIKEAVICHITITGNRHDGFEADDFGGKSYIEIYEAHVEDNGSEGITVRGVDTIQLEKINTRNNGDDGVDLIDGLKVTLKNFVSQGNSRRGIHICGFETVDIASGSSLDNGASGIQVMMVDKTTMSKLTVKGNSSADYGGGIYVAVGGSLKLSRSLVAENSASFGGGLYLSKLSDQSVIENSSIYNNKAVAKDDRAYGGGVYTNSSLKLSKAAVVANSAEATKAAGGGIYITGASGKLDAQQSTISSNSVTATPSSTTSSYALGGGFYIGLGGQASLSNMLLQKNKTQHSAVGEGQKTPMVRGGGLYKNSSKGTQVKIEKTDINDNSAIDGGGVYGAGSTGLTMATDTYFKNNKGGDMSGKWDWA